MSYLACAKALLDAPDAIFPQFATHNAGTIAAILQMGARQAVPFELQRLHGMGEGIYREVLKNPLVSCRVYAPVGAHRDLLAYLVRRLLENGANSSFVHQLADESVGMDELLISPLRLEPQASLPLPLDLYGAARANSSGRDLTVIAQRDELLAAHAACTVPVVAEAKADDAPRRRAACHRRFAAWNHTPVAQRAAVLRFAPPTRSTPLCRASAPCW